MNCAGEVSMEKSQVIGSLLDLLPKITTKPANRSKAEVAKLLDELASGEVIFFDGAIKESNPGGVAAYGWVHTSDGVVVADGGGVAEDGPGATVNVAEYAGLCNALKHVATLQPLSVRIVGDSQLVVRQVTGANLVHAKHLVAWVRRAKRSITALEFRGYKIELDWVIREVNTLADERADRAYRTYRGI
jgi:ribonuclease HI